MATVEYYLTITSPWTFLGHEEFRQIAAEAKATVVLKPVDFGAVFEVSGGLPLPRRAPQRQRYRLFELQRWRRRRNIPLNLHPKYFPADPTLGNKAVLAAQNLGLDAMALAGRVMHGVWCEEENAADPAYIARTASALGMDAAELMAAINDPQTDAQYAALTEEAKAAQVFGAPTYVIGGELWWGQDRLDFVREVLLDGQAILPDASAG